MTGEYEIVECFEITGRGVAVILDDISDRPVGKPLGVKVLKPDGDYVETVAFKEWLLRRMPTPIEKGAYILMGLHKEDIPSGSRLRFVQ
ncbi:hypothetical protein M0G74_12940 [Microbulbifer sp. CAU 1566]|uniref:hypothetical protein n=1 Tax=Microbulbifer sp. CAU 1566 TaxID=2933269 RepID=UPI0020051313|nr:hypothetical protein [Microbulbifer sp. CAU 1566]MCK7598182.1 hypothetical protein [Microbulbifer sp. CAU 1566]